MNRAALVLSILACLGAWGGPAVARSLITGDQIARNTVTGRNVAGLSGRDVVANGLDGSDIDEQSLEQVPSAKHANGATHVNGVDFDRFNYADPTGAKQTIYDRAGLTVTAFCNSGVMEATASSSATDALVRVAVTAPDTPTGVSADDTFGPGDTEALVPKGSDDVSGTLTYTVPNGPSVTITYLAASHLPARSGRECVLGGSAVTAKA